MVGNTRRNILLALTGLIVAYVRNFLQYHRYSYDSALEFLGSWFAHYLAIGLLGALFYSLSDWADRFILEKERVGKGLSVDEGLVYFCIAVIVCSVAVFFIAHWPAGLSDTFEE